MVSYNFWQSTYIEVEHQKHAYADFNEMGSEIELKCIASFKRNLKYIFCSKEHYVILLQLKKNKRPDGLTSSAATLTPGPEIGPLGHIIEMHIKLPQISMQHKNDVKPVESI